MKTNVFKLFVCMVCIAITGVGHAQVTRTVLGPPVTVLVEVPGTDNQVFDSETGEEIEEVEEDPDEIKDKALFKKQLAAAKKGNVKAQMALALHYLALLDKGDEGAGEKAITWLETAAKRKHATALRQLYYCYLEGQGVKKSNEKAISYLLQAAALDDIAALGDLAIHYCEVERNDEEALKWLRKSATQGSKIANSSTTKINKRIEAASIAKDGFDNAAVIYRQSYEEKTKEGVKRSELQKIYEQAKDMEEKSQKMRKLLDKLNEEYTLKEMSPTERRAYQAEKKKKEKEAEQKKHEITQKQRDARKEAKKKRKEKHSASKTKTTTTTGAAKLKAHKK